VPTYNERERIGELIETISVLYAASGLAGELVVVDDDSPDGTGAHVDALTSQYPLQVIHRAAKLGLGTAVIEGFKAARAPVVGVMDADLSHPPELLPVMLSVMQATDAEFVVGSRYIPGGGTRDWPAARLILSRLACWLAYPLTPVRDATSGFFLVRRDLVRDVQIAAGGFKICLELLVRGRPRAVCEVPYEFIGRTAGESKMNVREAFGYLRQLWSLQVFRWRNRRVTAAPRYWRLAASDVSRLRARSPWLKRPL
jgi:dolichol-phosphate mannosyltransferase